jgi:RNA polymerase sigma factor (TIGR02999 family)
MSLGFDDEDEFTAMDVLIKRMGQGDLEAKNELISSLYARFRRQAHQLLRNEHPGRSLGTTDLVDETLMRLLKYDELSKAADPHQVFRAFARAMRQALVDRGRRRRAKKRGRGWKRTEWDDFTEAVHVNSRAEILKLDEALRDLGISHERQREVLELKFFASLTNSEIAKVMRVSVRTVQSDLRFGVAWLSDCLSSHSGEDAP